MTALTSVHEQRRCSLKSIRGILTLYLCAFSKEVRFVTYSVVAHSRDSCPHPLSFTTHVVMLCFIVHPSTCNATVAGTSPPRSIFSDVYTNCVRNNRSRRRTFLTQCTEQFSSAVTLPSISTFEGIRKISQGQRLRFLAFLGETLAYLSYGTEEEPLLVIYFLDRLLELSGRSLVDWFHKHEPAEGKKLRVKGQELRQRGDEACALMIAMRVKKFLIRVYHFSASRCAAFSPRNKAVRKAAEKPIALRSRTATLELSDMPTESSSGELAFETIRRFAREMGTGSSPAKDNKKARKTNNDVPCDEEPESTTSKYDVAAGGLWRGYLRQTSDSSSAQPRAWRPVYFLCSFCVFVLFLCLMCVRSKSEKAKSPQDPQPSSKKNPKRKATRQRRRSIRRKSR